MSKPIWVALNSNGSILGTSLLREKDDPDFGKTWVQYAPASADMVEMCARVVELEALIREAADYLDINKMTAICSNSIGHRKFRAALPIPPTPTQESES